MAVSYKIIFHIFCLTYTVFKGCCCYDNAEFFREGAFSEAVMDGGFMSHKSVQIHEASSWVECALHCVKRLRCTIFNYKSSSVIGNDVNCQSFGKVTDLKSLIPLKKTKDVWTLYTKKEVSCRKNICQNGGQCCINSCEAGGYYCKCGRMFRGKNCETAMNDALYSSYILDGTPEYLKQLLQWFGDAGTEWRLCYRATQNGWRTNDFHSRCDHKGPTVTIIRVGNYIFGGYSDVAWGGDAAYKQTTKSFLFSLRNKDNLQPFTAAVYRNSPYAIYTNPGYGATFGGGHDLYIRDNAHISSGSYSNFGHTYKPPSGYSYGSNKAKYILAGAYNFLPAEIEVFYLA